MKNKLLNWYLSQEALPYWTVLIADCFLVFCSGIVAYVVNHGLAYTVSEVPTLLVALGVYLLLFLIGFRIFKPYVGIIRNTTTGDLIRVVGSLVTGVVLIMLLRIFIKSDNFILEIRFRDLVLQALFATFFMCGWRVIVKYFHDRYIKTYLGAGLFGVSADVRFNLEMNALMPREPVSIDMDTIHKGVKGKTIMVTGAAGSIGSELARILASFEPSTLILIDQAETPLHDVRLWMHRERPEVHCIPILTSVCHSHRMEVIFKQFRPEVIFHAAAYKHVPMMEDNPVESILNNVDGTRKLADLAVRYGVRKFIMVSTDKAVNPTNVMGCSKRLCEMYCQSLSRSPEANPSGCAFITTRFGNVLGSNGSVYHIFKEQIMMGGPVCVTHPDITRFFMLIPEACKLVLQAASMGKGGEIFTFDMGEPVKIADFARRMIEMSGRKNIEIRYTGLRPGEKLHEELLDEEEILTKTSHPRILVAKVREYDFSDIKEEIDELIRLARTYDKTDTVRWMKHIVPKFISKNSIYDKLDLENEDNKISDKNCAPADSGSTLAGTVVAGDSSKEQVQRLS